MASSVALVNKDIARHYQLANLLTPPEAIELTKLYNEMSDILSKPVKFRNQPTQLHLFYDLLSQYGKHFDNVTLEGIPKKPPSMKSPHPPDKPATATAAAAAADGVIPPIPPDDDDMTIFEDISQDDADQTIAAPTETSTPKQSREPSKALVVHPAHPSPIDLIRQAHTAVAKSAAKLVTPRSQIIKMLGLDKNADTPRNVISLIQRNDSTFNYDPESSSLIIHGHAISKAHFLKLLENLRNPQFKSPVGHDAYIIHKMSEAIQHEPQQRMKKLLEQLPGLKQYITGKPLETRASSAATNPAAKKRLEMDDTATTSTASHAPRRLAAASNTKGKGSSRKKPCVVVRWDRWKKHISKYVSSQLCITPLFVQPYHFTLMFIIGTFDFPTSGLDGGNNQGTLQKTQTRLRCPFINRNKM
jgi:hypothetical protein